MTTLLLTALILLQGIPVNANQTGTVTGVIRGADRKPLAGTRVAAVAPPDSLYDRTSAVMSSLAITDEQGRFTLEGIPQGRYYIAAGRVDYPTYYPGTLDIGFAGILSVSPGVTITGIEFSMAGDSTPLFAPGASLGAAIAKPLVPMKVTVEGGGKIPVFSGGKFVLVRFAPTSAISTTGAYLNDSFVELQNNTDFNVRLENLPEGYSIQSITYGSVDIQKNRLWIPPVMVLVGAAFQPRTLETITLVLKYSPPPPVPTGVRVTGKAADTLSRSVYISGIPGTYYADGTFEFRGVPPGIHLLAGLDSVLPLGTLVAVGDRDLTGVELINSSSPVPFNLRNPRDPDPLGDTPAGTVMPLATVSGKIIEETSRKPLAEGTIKITGYAKTETVELDAKGQFEFPRLFPGTYTVDFESFGHAKLTETVTVGAKNLTLDLTTRRLY